VIADGTLYRCVSRPGDAHRFASRWPACDAPFCRAEPGHQGGHDFPSGPRLIADRRGVHGDAADRVALDPYGDAWHLATCRGGCPETPWDAYGYRAATFPESLDGYCFKCAFWLSAAGETDAGTVICERGGRLERWHFDAAKPVKDVADKSLLGCGGGRWTIRFHDGRVAETNDLWGSGEIPERFRGLFPVNADLISQQWGR
jgi:hypothetical protein